ncbi:MAG: phosphoenolpyruvate carboxykinase (ATP), partial [Candidatus Marinimicrobia bacterium]|nr:phosphoenolpyruvate carboxykinase (ATP) [Candidatus Neomarinimicrobiota bacterium]
MKKYFKKIGIKSSTKIYRNLPVERLIEYSLLRDNARIGMNGATMIDTGEYTGRSPNDKYFVKEKSSEKLLWWGPVNKKVDEKIFDELYEKIINYYNDSKEPTFLFDGYAGADVENRLSIRVIAKKAWQAHFVHNMFIRPSQNELENFKEDFTIINASDVKNKNFREHGLNSETFIIFNLEKKIAIIGGTEYGGEMKKGVFSLMHYLLPQKNILSMHCSANVDNKGENAALFFGLSGTGKTTLSTDPNRPLIGDDEHGWSDKGIFNFEGGCYAKVINLSKEDEPDIYNAIKHGSLLENVVYDQKSRKIDFFNNSKTENTRVSYPIDYISNSLNGQGKPSIAGHPRTIIFLTCDAFGVLPAVSMLNEGQAMYHFINGYTAKIAGTERGIKEPVATFSPCYGGPFLTLHPLRYAELLKEKMQKFNSSVYLVNTGWIGGTPESGTNRISIQNTRAIITSILN